MLPTSDEGHQVYRLSPHLRLERDASGRAYLLGEQQRIPVGADQVQLFEWLAQDLTLSDLGERSGPRLAQHLYALHRHVGDGHVIAGHDAEALADPHTAWLASAGRPKAVAHAVALDFVRPNDAAGSRDVVERALLAGGLTIDPHSAVRLLVVDDYRNPDVGALLQRLLARTGTRCVPFRPFGRTAWLGPVVGAGHACWACLQHRLLDNSPIESTLSRAAGNATLFQGAAPSVPESLTVAAAFAATRLLGAPVWPTTGDTRMPLWTLDLSSFQVTAHATPQRPQCSACGDTLLMSRQGHRPVTLGSVRKTFMEDGGHRVVTPEVTFENLKHLVSPLTGLVSNLGLIHARSDTLRQVYGATHFVTPARGDALEADRFEMVSVGKGKTVAQARTSALCEALERKCARYQGDEAVVVARVAELGDGAIVPGDLLLFSERQYAQPVSPDPRRYGFHSPRSQQVPARFQPDQPMAWTPVWSLSHQRTRWIPLAYGFAGTPTGGQARVCNWDSNGCATGNCLEEAVLQGLLELVERDAAAIHWYNRIPRPEVTPETFDDPYFEQVKAHYAALGHELWVLDITHDLGAWVFFAIARERDGSRYAAGLGCHLDPRLALHRALSELHQVFDPGRTGAPLWDGRDVPDARHLMPEPWSGPQAPTYTNHASEDLAQDVSWLLARLGQRGLEALVLDYSRPDTPLHAIKAIVPGLRHFWPRYAPGRLYDVPVDMGWRPVALTERELNPLPLHM